MNTELIKIEAVQELVQGAPAALIKNNNIMLAGIKQADELIVKIQAQGMNDELDQECNNWQVKAKKGISLMDETRKPITQMLDAIKKKFTELEAPLDPKKDDSKYAAIQEFRNQYAKKKAIEEQKRQEEIQRKQNYELEINSITAYFEQTLKQAEIQTRFNKKAYLSKLLDDTNLADIDNLKTSLERFNLSLNLSKFNEIEIILPKLIYVDGETARKILTQTRLNVFEEMQTIHLEDLENHKSRLIEQISSKKLELQEIENAKNDKLKQEILKKQQEERLAEEQQNLKKQQEEETKKAIENVTTNKEIVNANTLSDAANNLAEGALESNSTVRQGYKIIVSSPVGFQQIAAFWFQKEGLTLSLESLEKKSLGQMKTFCEKHYHKTGEKIESTAIKYEQDFKAIATKS